MVECPKCDGNGREYLGFKYVCNNSDCGQVMAKEATKCVHCGNPNWEGQGYTPERKWGDRNSCPYCEGTGRVTERQASEMRAESVANVSRGCFYVSFLLLIQTVGPIFLLWYALYDLFGINIFSIVSCIF